MTDAEKTELYERFEPKVRGYIFGKLGNNAYAEDLTSDVFLKVFANIDKYDSTKASLSTWIYKITQNTVYDYFRTRREYLSLSDDMADTVSVEDDVANGEMLDTLADALETLSPDERNIVILYYYSGYKLTEISQRLSRPYSSVKVMLHRSLKKIKNFFENV